MMSKNSIVPFLKDYLIKFLTRPFLLDTNDLITFINLDDLITMISNILFLKRQKLTSIKKLTTASNKP